MLTLVRHRILDRAQRTEAGSGGRLRGVLGVVLLASALATFLGGCVVTPGYVAPAPVYYAPAPVVVAPAPVFVYGRRGGYHW
jgi:hypothetical protein